MAPRIWWDNATIDATFSRQFAIGNLPPRGIERLDQILGFGEDLANDTYWDWIEKKARKVFLILVELGLADQIFGLIDDSYDDEDLPIALDHVWRLKLTPARDEQTDLKFYLRQFHYLLKPLQRGDHTIYQDHEIVPLELPNKKHADKVVLPDQPGKVFNRRQIALGPGRFSEEDFLLEINNIKELQNAHLLSYWASYTYRNHGYILFTPATEFSLRSLLTTTPSCLKTLEKKMRRQTVMHWILCLVNTVCFLHEGGRAHGNIKPSTVRFSTDNCVFLSDFTRLHSEALDTMTDKEKILFDKEAYDYSPPEKWYKPIWSLPTPSDLADGAALPLDPKAGDVFSLGCVILEILSFLLKKHGRPFAAHRATKRKSPGRGGAVLDASFHKNLEQLETWMTLLDDEASKKDDPLFKGFPPMLHAVTEMLAFDPLERPTIMDVQAKMREIITEMCGIPERHHMQQHDSGDIGMGPPQLSLSLLPTSFSNNTVSGTGDGTTGPQSGDDNTSNIQVNIQTTNGASEGSVQRSSSSSRGSRGSDHSLEYLLRGAARNSAPARPGNEFARWDKASQQVITRENVRRAWQAPLYDGKYFVLMDR